MYFYFLLMGCCFVRYIHKKPIESICFAVSALIMGRSASWYYLIYNGRMPERVTLPLHLAELLILAALFVNCHAVPTDKETIYYIGKKSLIGKAASLVFIAMALFPLLNGAWEEYHGAGSRALGLYAYNEGLATLGQYCSVHPGNIYLVDTKTLTYYTKNLFGLNDNVYQNYMVMGSWLTKSPLMDEKMERMGITDLPRAFKQDNVYIMFGDHEEFSQDYFWEYLGEEYEYSAILYDTVELSDYSSMLVYKIE
jgi:hypothetical protein